MPIIKTPRLGLPLLAAGQAQKEIVHNEALTLADMLVQPMVESIGETAPPAASEPGKAWILGAAPTGAWSGQAQAIAAWTEGGWRFVPAAEGLHAFVRDVQLWAAFRDGDWVTGRIDAAEFRVDGVRVIGPRQNPIAEASGGGVIDGEARAAIGSILAAMRAHGLISP